MLSFPTSRACDRFFRGFAPDSIDTHPRGARWGDGHQILRLYAGVIIGPDLRLDPTTGRIVADRDRYRDKKGKENTGHLKDAFTDDELLTFIRNIYGVLLTRGMLGTYVYVCDPLLRERLRRVFV